MLGGFQQLFLRKLFAEYKKKVPKETSGSRTANLNCEPESLSSSLSPSEVDSLPIFSHWWPPRIRVKGELRIANCKL